MLAKVKDSISFESFMDLRNLKLSRAQTYSWPMSWRRPWKSLQKVHHDEAIWKAVSYDKPASKGKKLHFFQASQQQPQQPLPKKSSGSSTRLSFQSSSSSSSSSKALFLFLSLREGEEILKAPCLPHSHKWEVF